MFDVMEEKGTGGDHICGVHIAQERSHSPDNEKIASLQQVSTNTVTYYIGQFRVLVMSPTSL